MTDDALSVRAIQWEALKAAAVRPIAPIASHPILDEIKTVGLEEWKQCLIGKQAPRAIVRGIINDDVEFGDRMLLAYPRQSSTVALIAQRKNGIGEARKVNAAIFDVDADDAAVAKIPGECFQRLAAMNTELNERD